MRRIGRWMLNGLTVLSLVLCVAVVVLWVRSYWLTDNWITAAGSSRHSVGSAGGFVFFSHTIVFPRPNVYNAFWPPPGYHTNRYSSSTYTPPPQWQFLGFAGTHTQTIYMALTYRRFPDWALVAATAIGPLLWIGFRRPVPSGHCRRCRYDLTGNVSGVCPECGMAISNPKTRIANLKVPLLP